MYQGGGAKYGIWGETPSFGNPFASGMELARSFSDARRNNSQSNLFDLEAQAYPLKVEKQQLENQYYPQSQAILLANAINKQDETDRKTDRFGNPVFLATKTLGVLPTASKANYIAENAGRVGRMVDSQLDMANNYDPSGQQQGQGRGQNIKSSILQPFLPQGSQQQPIQQGGLNPYAGQNPQSAQQPIPYSASAQAIGEGARNDYTNKVYSVQDRNRIAAGGRAQVLAEPLTQEIQNIINPYTGISGRASLIKDKALSAAGGTPSEAYQPYLKFNSDLEGFQAEYAQVLGKRNTDHAMEEVRRIASPEMFFSNPELVQAVWAHTLHNLQKMEEVNKLTPDKRLQQAEIDKIVNSKPENGPKYGVYWHNGKPYTLGQLQKMKGGK